MKKVFLAVLVAMATVTSCTTTTKTARTESMPYSMYNANAADLEVGERITHTLTPNAEIRRGGEVNCKRAAIQEALKAANNADLLVEPQFIVSKRRGLIRTTITSVTVSGRPAKYINFRSLNDSVWCNPVFRGVPVLREVDLRVR